MVTPVLPSVACERGASITRMPWPTRGCCAKRGRGGKRG